MRESVEETPWAQVQRLRGEGESFEQIIAALQARGLAREDLELLLQDDPAFRAWSRGAPAPAPATTGAAQGTPAPATPPTDVGRLVRWTVITFSALACGSIAAFARTGLGLGLSFAALLPAVVLISLEFRKGLRRTARPAAFVLFFAFFLPFLSGLILGWELPQLATGPLFLLSVPLLVWASRTGEKLHGLTDYGASVGGSRGNVFESNDVQFCVKWSTQTHAPGEAVGLTILAQNCVDVPRDLTLHVRADARSGFMPQRHTFELEPGCVVELRVPVRVPLQANEGFSFVVDLAGSGVAKGNRVRLAKGAEWVSPSDALLGNLVGVATLALVGAGRFTLGSNGAITVKVDANRPAVTREEALEVVTRYRPDAATLAAAAKS